jgi:spore maturation protein CgeB
MIEKICFLVFDNFYSSKRFFTGRLAEAFLRQGAEVRLVDIEGGVMSKEDLENLYSFEPTCTFSFNTMQPMKDGKYLWDALQIPHILFPLDPMIYYLEYVKSPYSILAYVDRKDQAVLENANFKRSFFLPHGVERELLDRDISGPRDCDVVLFGSCYDHKSVRQAWEREHPKEVCAIIEEAIEMTLAEPYTSFLEAIVSCWGNHKVDPKSVNFESIAFYVDYYLRGFDRMKLLEALKDFKIAVFGDCFWVEGKDLRGWESYVGDMPNVEVFQGVPFVKSLDLLQRSRVCLNSTPFFKDGSHERFLTGLGTGCSILASDNLWAKETFGEGQGVSWYSFGKWDQVPDLVFGLLRDEEKRLEQAFKGREIVRAGHTWDARAQEISQFMSMN